MSSKQVMSHDPLAGDDEEIVGDVPAVPEGLATSEAATQEVRAGALILPELMTISEVGDLYSELGALLAGGGVVSMDGGSVESIDGAGLQLLAAFVKDLTAKSGAVNWIAVSDALRASAIQLGLSGALQFDKTPKEA